MNSQILFPASWKAAEHSQPAGHKKVLRIEELKVLASEVVNEGQKNRVR